MCNGNKLGGLLFLLRGLREFFFLSALFGRLSDGVEFVEVNKMEVKN